MNFIKTIENHVDIYINMDNVMYVKSYKGYCDVSQVGQGRTVRIAGEAAARFLRQIERPDGPATTAGK